MRKSVMAIGVLAALTVLPFVGCTLSDAQYKRGFVPAKLSPRAFRGGANCGSVLSYQGAYRFTLDRRTVAALKANGIRFFDDIETPENRAARSYFTGEWKTTPMSAKDLDEVSDRLLCARTHAWFWPPNLSEALQQPGGFYQTAGGRALIVLPTKGHIIAVASDR